MANYNRNELGDMMGQNLPQLVAPPTPMEKVSSTVGSIYNTLSGYPALLLGIIIILLIYILYTWISSSSIGNILKSPFESGSKSKKKKTGTDDNELSSSVEQETDKLIDSIQAKQAAA
jgi:hypothetical protein